MTQTTTRYIADRAIVRRSRGSATVEFSRDGVIGRTVTVPARARDGARLIIRRALAEDYDLCMSVAATYQVAR